MTNEPITHWTEVDAIASDEEIAAWVRKEHARRYPDGCGETLALCCEDCVERFAATLDRRAGATDLSTLNLFDNPTKE